MFPVLVVEITAFVVIVGFAATDPHFIVPHVIEFEPHVIELLTVTLFVPDVPLLIVATDNVPEALIDEQAIEPLVSEPTDIAPVTFAVPDADMLVHAIAPD